MQEERSEGQEPDSRKEETLTTTDETTSRLEQSVSHQTEDTQANNLLVIQKETKKEEDEESKSKEAFSFTFPSTTEPHADAVRETDLILKVDQHLRNKTSLKQEFQCDDKITNQVSGDLFQSTMDKELLNKPDTSKSSIANEDKSSKDDDQKKEKLQGLQISEFIQEEPEIEEHVENILTTNSDTLTKHHSISDQISSLSSTINAQSQTQVHLNSPSVSHQNEILEEEEDEEETDGKNPKLSEFRQMFINQASRPDLHLFVPQTLMERNFPSAVEAAFSHPTPPPPSNSPTLNSELRSTTPEPSSAVYQVKWIRFNNQDCAIITQNQNGPCPLLAIVNILLLRGKFSLAPGTKIVTGEQLTEFLGACILDSVPKNLSESVQLNYEQNMHDAISTFSKLKTGLDVNVKFDTISSFEYTSELIIFDLLEIQLYHGWLVGQEEHELKSAIRNLSYNQLVEKIITNKASPRPELVAEAILAEDFLDKTASQLTYSGLTELISNVKEGELSILFRNNHFITLYKFKDQLYQLVTDQGFLQENNIVWETLNNIDNDGIFVDGEFKAVLPKSEISPAERKEQIDQDYLIALSLQEEQNKQIEQNEQWNQYKDEAGLSSLSDEELARKLQQEEHDQYTHMQLRERKNVLNSEQLPTSLHRQNQPRYDARSPDAQNQLQQMQSSNQSYTSNDASQQQPPNESNVDTSYSDAASEMEAVQHHQQHRSMSDTRTGSRRSHKKPSCSLM